MKYFPLFLLVVMVVLGGCNVLTPNRSAARNARFQAERVYHGKLAESYAAGNPAYSTDLKPPVRMYWGVLINRQRVPVDFHVIGEVSLAVTVEPKCMTVAELPRGYYTIWLYKQGEENPYRSSTFWIDNQSGDIEIQGKHYDWSITAP